MLRGELPPDLTPAELRVMRLRASGLTAAQTAARLGIAVQTSKNHTRNAYQRLGVATLGRGVTSSVVLIRALVRLGWLRVPEPTGPSDSASASR